LQVFPSLPFRRTGVVPGPVSDTGPSADVILSSTGRSSRRSGPC
jgi:hypothetical protein